jgi:hypothetical protein
MVVDLVGGEVGRDDDGCAAPEHAADVRRLVLGAGLPDDVAVQPQRRATARKTRFLRCFRANAACASSPRGASTVRTLGIRPRRGGGAPGW